ncbi:uncharacterized protein LOC112342430 [Selaginella moellendorffii]|uniref:uncharacterized protein LOC112342430 n=1 Tax=Selaginella moellendorffii TaxID=88036 RepID=UPI000D1C91C2|nr:uncharacterized protein LOC112342430 [Selaginella moellendorffii]|eukprot:XP_024519991.1 uncharacterized protein LOC112342430 [Selaginella moellendorffii]
MRAIHSIAVAGAPGDRGGRRQSPGYGAATGAGSSRWRTPKNKSGSNAGIPSIYDALQQAGAIPGVGVVLAALTACRNSRDLQTGKRVHSYVAERTNYCSSNSVVANSVLDMYAKCGSMEDALQAFSEMKHRDVVSWTSMISGYARCGDGALALKFFARMQEEGCEPDRVTVIAAVKACSSCAEKEEAREILGRAVKIKSLEQGRALHSRVARAGFVRDLAVANSLVDMYSKCGSMEDAQKVFESMRQRDVISWTSIISGYAQAGEAEFALKLYSRMQDEGCGPDRVTLLAALKACASLAEGEKDGPSRQKWLEQGRAIHSKVVGSGNQSANSLLDFYAKCGSMEDACTVFQAMGRHSSISWKCMILGYVYNGEFEQALEFYKRMQLFYSSAGALEQISPGVDSRTRTSSLMAMGKPGTQSHTGLVRQAQRCSNEMEEKYGVRPAEHLRAFDRLVQGRRGTRREPAVPLVARFIAFSIRALRLQQLGRRKSIVFVRARASRSYNPASGRQQRCSGSVPQNDEPRLAAQPLEEFPQGLASLCCWALSSLVTLCASACSRQSKEKPRRGLSYIVSCSFIKKRISNMECSDVRISLKRNSFLTVQNRETYAPYTRFKAAYEAMEKDHPDLGNISAEFEPADAPEVLKFLWHGTQTKNVASIMERGMLSNRANAYGRREAYFWFTPTVRYARLHTSNDTKEYTIVLCATLSAQKVDEDRFTVDSERPDLVLPLAEWHRRQSTMRAIHSIAAAGAPGDRGGHRKSPGYGAATGAGAGSSRWRTPKKKSGSNAGIPSIYDALQQAGAIPGVGVVLAALTACRNSRDLQTGKRVHSYVAERTNYCSSNSVVANSVLDMYAKCGSMEDALQAFSEMKHRDVVSWTSMISGYARCGDGALALKFFARMQEEGCEPDRVTVIAAVKACSSCAEKEEAREILGRAVKIKSLEQGRALHSRVARAGFVRDLAVANSLVDMYSKCGSMEDAQKVFESMRQRDVISWTSIISGYAQAGEAEFALKLYSRMQDEGCGPDRVTLLAALKACASLAEGEKDGPSRQKWLEQGRVIHSKAVASGNQSDHFVANSLLDFYAKCGSMEDACTVFQAMGRHSSISWKCMILGYVHNGESEQALEFYKRMQSTGCVADRVTLLATLKACSTLTAAGASEEALGTAEKERLVKFRLKCLETGARIHSQAGTLDLAVANSVIDLYAKCGRITLARNLFESLPQKNTVSWNCIIIGYAECGEGAVSLELYRQMRHTSGCAPDAGTFVAVLKACSSLVALEFGRQIQMEARSFGLERDPIVANALVSFFAKCGSMAEAEEVFSSILKKDLVTWSSLIAGYSCRGDATRVLDLFERMEKVGGVKPDGVTLLSVLTACSHAGLVDRAKDEFRAMLRKHGIAPTIQHYTCMVELLGRANQLDEAVKLVKGMSCKPDVVIWKAVLGACWKWKNVALGRLAFESIMELDNQNAPAYVLMANLYAEAGMLEEAARMRRSLS